MTAHASVCYGRRCNIVRSYTVCIGDTRTTAYTCVGLLRSTTNVSSRFFLASARECAAGRLTRMRRRCQAAGERESSSSSSSSSSVRSRRVQRSIRHFLLDGRKQASVCLLDHFQAFLVYLQLFAAWALPTVRRQRPVAVIVVDRAQDGRLGLASAVGMVIVERRRKSLVLTRLSRLGLDQTRPASASLDASLSVRRANVSPNRKRRRNEYAANDRIERSLTQRPNYAGRPMWTSCIDFHNLPEICRSINDTMHCFEQIDVNEIASNHNHWYQFRAYSRYDSNSIILIRFVANLGYDKHIELG